MRHLTALFLCLTACGSIQSKAPRPDAGSGEPGAPDAPAPPGGEDAPTSTARCDRTRPFGVPTRLDQFNPLRGPRPSLTVSGDELFAVVSERLELRGGSRPDLESEFATPTADPLFANLDLGQGLEVPSITGDALQIYYAGDEGFIEHAARPDSAQPFAPTGRIVVQNANLIANGFQISSDGQTLYWIDLGDSKLRAATSVDPGRFNAARVIATMTVRSLALAPDELRLYYNTGAEILVSTRTTLQRLFEPGTAQAELTAGTLNTPLVVTADDCELYFSSDRDQVSRTDIFRARRGL